MPRAFPATAPPAPRLMPRVPSPPASPPAARLAPSPTAAPRNAAPNAFLGGGELFPGATAGELYYEFHAQDGTPETAASAAARHSRAAAASASAAAAAAAARAAMTRAERRAAQLERCRGRTAEQFGSLASRGFIAALDQSGGSTPRALALYGVSDIRAGDKSEMFDAAHAMRTRIVTSEAFDGEKVFGAILFADTAFARLVRGKPTASYLWEDKGIVPFLKIDVGLQPEANGVQLMRDIDDLGVTLSRCGRRDPKLDDDDASSEDTGYPKPPKPLNPGDGDPGLCIFGTKARSVIRSNDPNGIDALVAQQFELAARVMDHGLVPIVEPEVDIDCKDKARSSIRFVLVSRVDRSAVPFPRSGWRRDHAQGGTGPPPRHSRDPRRRRRRR